MSTGVLTLNDGSQINGAIFRIAFYQALSANRERFLVCEVQESIASHMTQVTCVNRIF